MEIGLDELERDTTAWMKSPAARLVELHYEPAAFNRWPSAPPIIFNPDTDPNYPLRTRLSHRTARK